MPKWPVSKHGHQGQFNIIAYVVVVYDDDDDDDDDDNDDELIR